MSKYERNFRPSAYDDDISTITELTHQLSPYNTGEVYTIAPAETIPGFRVQVFLTKEIEQASAMQDSLSRLVADQMVYLVYDSPYYKVRIGNFHNRADANSTLKKVINLGYTEAWIVPDNVLKNPIPKLPDSPIELDRSIRNNH